MRKKTNICVKKIVSYKYLTRKLNVNNILIQSFIKYATYQLQNDTSTWMKAEGSTPGIMVNMLGCDTLGSEFEIRSLDYVHFWKNTLEEAMNFIILPVMD